MNTQPAPRPTPNQIKLRAAVFADQLVKGASARNLAAICAYGDWLNDPQFARHPVPSPIMSQFYRAMTAAANEELMGFVSSLLDDEERLTLLEDEIARLVASLTKDERDAREAGQS